MTTADASALSYSSAPGRWVLAITVLGPGIVSLDAKVVNIALPTIGRDFHTGVAALQFFPDPSDKAAIAACMQ